MAGTGYPRLNERFPGAFLPGRWGVGVVLVSGGNNRNSILRVGLGSSGDCDLFGLPKTHSMKKKFIYILICAIVGLGTGWIYALTFGHLVRIP